MGQMYTFCGKEARDTWCIYISLDNTNKVGWGEKRQISSSLVAFLTHTRARVRPPFHPVPLGSSSIIVNSIHKSYCSAPPALCTTPIEVISVGDTTTSYVLVVLDYGSWGDLLSYQTIFFKEAHQRKMRNFYAIKFCAGSVCSAQGFFFRTTSN